jgi:hypothetical protein
MSRNLVVATAACATALTLSLFAPGVAVATPPTGGVQFTDLARAQAVEGAKIPIKLGTTLASGAYAVASGGETGWRRLPGPAILAVNKGTMTVRRADGCSVKEYAAGQAAVVPSGTYRIDNAGRDALQFYGVFFDLPADAPKPLAEGPTVAAPADCGFTAASAPSGVSLSTPKAGAMVPGMFGRGASLVIEPGKDIYVAFLDFSPGFSSGWITHTPMVNIVSGGVLRYVMAHHGHCETGEHYPAGQAFFHPPHTHMVYNDSTEHVLLTSVYVDVPHDDHPAPVVGNITEANDFFQAPPEGCPRLR